MVDVFEVIVGEQHIKIQIEGLLPYQRPRLNAERVSFEDVGQVFYQWATNNLERSDFPMPFRDVYQAFNDYAKINKKPQMSANRFSRELSDIFGKGRAVRYPATGNVVPGAMVRFKATAATDQPAPVAPSPRQP